MCRPGLPYPVLMVDPLDAVDWPVRTERLSLRRCEAGDAESTWRFRRLPEVAEWITVVPQSFDDYRTLFLEPARLSQALVIELADNRLVIGDIMVRIEDAWAQAEVAELARGTQAELGWTLDPAFGGRGYATEAVGAVIDLCFGTLGLRRLHAECFADNEPSWRLMERLGMRREARLRKESLHRSGRWLDGLSYALLAEERSLILRRDQGIPPRPIGSSVGR